MAKKNEKDEAAKAAEQAVLNAAIAKQKEDEAAIEAAKEEQRKSLEVFASKEKGTEGETQQANTDELKFDDDGNVIAPASSENATLAQTAESAKPTKSFLAKRLKEELGIDELNDEDDDEKVFEVFKKVKTNGDIAIFATKAEVEFENSDEYKGISEFVNLSNEEKYTRFLISKNIQEGYSEDLAKQRANREIKAAKKRYEDAKAQIEEGEDVDAIDEIAENAIRLNNLAKQDLQIKKEGFAKAKAEAAKLNTSVQTTIADTIKNAKDILAVSDTILGINFTDKAKKQVYIENTMKFINSGEAKKVLSDPNELKEFLVWRSNKGAYEARLKNIGRQEEIYRKSAKPTVTTSTANAHQQVQQNKPAGKLDPKGF